MHGDANLRNHLEKSLSIETGTIVTCEWNMNIPGNIEEVGNYRRREDGLAYTEEGEGFKSYPNQAYTQNATNADIIVDGNIYEDEDMPIMFIEDREKFKLLYSLDECFTRNRPRSGINKPLFLGYPASDASSSQWLNNYGSFVAERPRYYMSSRYDNFKYWTSFRTEKSNEFGVSRTVNGKSVIEDVAPYVIYKDPVPSNRVVIKMQTNVSNHNIGEVRTWKDSEKMGDPLYDNRFDELGEMIFPEQINATIPDDLAVEFLVNNEWVEVFRCNNELISSDGYLEMAYTYTQQIPNNVVVLGFMPSVQSLPNTTAKINDGYYVGNDFYWYNGTDWIKVERDWAWIPAESIPDHHVKGAENFLNSSQEFVKIKGMRIVVREMVRDNITFDLIEFSPRLLCNISDRVADFNISKSVAELGNSSLPVGSLQASVGTVNVNNNDGIFTNLNQNSAIGPYLRNNIKFTFYDIVKDVEFTTTDELGQESFYKDNVVIPIKTLYSETYPSSTGNFDSLVFNLRDTYTRLENTQAPEIFLTDVSLSYAITILLDSIGFTNVKFYRAPEENELVIPFFFVPPNKNVAQVLSELATASQSAMWFDEYNNLCVGSRGWLFPEGWEDPKRVTVLSGNTNNDYTQIANIVNVSSDEKKVANDGNIQYNQRYIERSYSSIKEAHNTSAGKSWVYKPSLLWEISGTGNLRESSGGSQSSTAAMSAVPLATDLGIAVPEWNGVKIVNQIIDVGENVNWLVSNSGYFYSSGEIIKFDAMEYAVTGSGTVWVEALEDYQNYLSNLPFNGKIYPTGRIRIFAETEYNDEGKVIGVKSHGRGQFGTDITTHTAGLNSHWTNAENLNGFRQDSSVLFRTGDYREYPVTMTHPPLADTDTALGVNNNAKNSTVSSVIKNIFVDDYQLEKEKKKFGSSNRETVQASSLGFQGPTSFPKEEDGTEKSANFVSYLYKDFYNTRPDPDDPNRQVRTDYPYKHFGTRMKIIGELLSQNNNSQMVIGNNEFINIQAENEKDGIVLTGGSGGIAVSVDPRTHEGYYFEIAALSNDLTDKVSPNYTHNASATYSTSSCTFTTTTEHTISVGDKVIVTPNSSQFNPNQNVYQACGVYEVASVDKDNGKIVTKTGANGSGGSSSPMWRVVKMGQDTSNINNLLFYKLLWDDTKSQLVPYVLWEGIADIIVDQAIFTDIQRNVGDSITSVYDLAVEWEQKPGRDTSGQPYPKTFTLFINDKQVGRATDKFPYKSKKNSFALFTRGKSKVMFNNVYALADRIGDSTVAPLVEQPNKIFGVEGHISNSEVLNKYGISGMVQQRYLEGINIESGPSVRMYFDEFGSIMRECKFINAKYDLAFPALTAKLVPSFNSMRSYVTSQFIPGCYGAEFLIFNTTDTVLTMTAETGNFVRILGVAFTQDMSKQLTVDDYFNRVADLSNPPQIDGNGYSPYDYEKQWKKIKDSRYKYDRVEFQALQSEYIQDPSTAESLLGWIVSKTHKPRQIVGMNTFGTNHIQLGDIVTIDYQVTPNNNPSEVNAIAPPDKKFIVYKIDMQKAVNNLQNTLFLVEV